MDDTFQNNIDKQRYELKIGEYLAWADYHIENDSLVIPHVEAEPALRGTGAAGRLMERVMEEAKSHNLKIVPLCSYAAAWIKRHSGL